MATLYVVPQMSIDCFWVGKMLNNNNISISYVSPEFEDQFFPLVEKVTNRDLCVGWIFTIDKIVVPEINLPLRLAQKPVRLQALYSLILSSSLPVDGSVTVACVIDANQELRLVTTRWGGKGWIFRSYPIDFRRVLRKGRQFLTSFSATEGVWENSPVK